MKIRSLIIASLITLLLTGCGVSDIAKSAADATACKALSSTISAISDSYQAGVSESGIITKIDNLVGEQARSLLSTELAQDLKSLTDALRQSETAQGSKADVTAIADSIKERCSNALGGAIGGALG
jgi:hypothetical protein